MAANYHWMKSLIFCLLFRNSVIGDNALAIDLGALLPFP